MRAAGGMGVACAEDDEEIVGRLEKCRVRAEGRVEVIGRFPRPTRAPTSMQISEPVWSLEKVGVKVRWPRMEEARARRRTMPFSTKSRYPSILPHVCLPDRTEQHATVTRVPSHPRIASEREKKGPLLPTPSPQTSRTSSV